MDGGSSLTNNELVLTVAHFGNFIALKLLEQILLANVVLGATTLFAAWTTFATARSVRSVVEHEARVHIVARLLIEQHLARNRLLMVAHFAIETGRILETALIHATIAIVIVDGIVRVFIEIGVGIILVTVVQVGSH